MSILPFDEIGALAREKRVYEYAQMLAQNFSEASVQGTFDAADADAVTGLVFQKLTFDETVTWSTLTTYALVTADAGAVAVINASPFSYLLP